MLQMRSGTKLFCTNINLSLFTHVTVSVADIYDHFLKSLQLQSFEMSVKPFILTTISRDRQVIRILRDRLQTSLLTILG